MASPPGELRGFTFAPSDAEILNVYLKRKIAGSPLPAPTVQYIHDADVYAADPAALVAGLLSAPTRNDEEVRVWYFYTYVPAKSIHDTRRCRAVAGGVGTWHSEKARQKVPDDEGGGVAGYRRPFTYEPKNGWLMLEFTQEDARRGEPMPVLCKIYQTRRDGRSASKSKSRSKRKAAAADDCSDAGSSSSARVRRCLHFRPPAAPFLVAASEIQEPFLVPIERRQADQEPEEPQEPEVRATLAATALIPSFPMAADHALTFGFDRTTFLLPSQDWATAENSPLGNYSFVSPATSELSCYNTTTPLSLSDNAGVWDFPPSALTSSYGYGTTLLPSGGEWATPESSQLSAASTLENYYGCFSPDHATPRPTTQPMSSCFSPDHATSRPTTQPMSNDAGFWSFLQYSEPSAIFGA